MSEGLLERLSRTLDLRTDSAPSTTGTSGGSAGTYMTVSTGVPRRSSQHAGPLSQPSLCLGKGELFELTGYKHRKKQIEALVYMEVHFRISPDGDIKVLRSDLDRNPNEPTTRSQEPKFETLKTP